MMYATFRWLTILALWLAPAAMLGLVALALLSLFTLGGARRNAMALLASGVCCILTGAILLYGSVASYYAAQDNAYLINVYLGLLLMLVSAGVMLPGGLAGMGLHRIMATALAVLGLAGVIGVYACIGLYFPKGGVFVVYDVLAQLGVVALALLALRRVGVLLGALGLGAVGIVVALALWFIPAMMTGTVNLAVYTQFGVDRALADKPPILDGNGAATTIFVAVAVFVAGRLGHLPPRPADAPATVAV
ncbi:MAG TPA: hypothetical protein VF792_11275 [Ktedonobacterales bacterium]